MIYRELTVDDVDLSMFACFDRTQNVTKCWRKVDGEWVIQDIAFVDNWSEQEYREGVEYLRNLIRSKGYVVGAFWDGHLKGFASVEPAVFGSHAQYMDLSNLHVSQDMRRKGIGKELFLRSKRWAREHGAEKLYISAHSAVESQAFYVSMGCVEALEYKKELVEREPCDCQLECVL